MEIERYLNAFGWGIILLILESEAYKVSVAALCIALGYLDAKVVGTWIPKLKQLELESG